MATGENIFDERVAVEFLRDLVHIGGTRKVIDFAQLHRVHRQSTCFVEADRLETRTLNCLLGHGSNNVLSTETHEAEGVCEVEENGEGSWETVSNKIDEPHQYHNWTDLQV